MRTKSSPPPSPTGRSPQCRRAALVAAVLAAALSGHVWADDYLDPIGGPGGGSFSARCNVGAFMAGFELRAGEDVDAIRPICVTVQDPSAVRLDTPIEWQGGTGGSPAGVACPRSRPIVNGLVIEVEIPPATKVVNGIMLYCSPAGGALATEVNPSAYFSAPYNDGLGRTSNGIPQRCPAGQLAVGVHGRSGYLIDAVGLICGAPPEPAKTLGRVKTSTPSPPRPPGWTICDSARDARSRNSPAAPNLEAQCAKLPAKPIGRVPPTGTASPYLPPRVTPAPPPESPAPPVESDASVAKRASRDAALRELMGTIVSGINKSRQRVRQPSPRGPDVAVSGRPAEGTGERRQDDRDPPNEQDASEFDQDASSQAPSQPENSIRIEVRYPAVYGYRDPAGEMDPGPNSCSAFYISALPASSTLPGKLTEITTQPHMRSENDLYVCEYLILDQPLDQPLMVRVAMSDERAAGSAQWLGGDQAQPPPGQRRTIMDGVRDVTLTANEPRASLRFDMTYSGSP